MAVFLTQLHALTAIINKAKGVANEPHTVINDVTQVNVGHVYVRAFNQLYRVEQIGRGGTCCALGNCLYTTTDHIQAQLLMMIEGMNAQEEVAHNARKGALSATPNT